MAAHVGPRDDGVLPGITLSIGFWSVCQCPQKALKVEKQKVVLPKHECRFETTGLLVDLHGVKRNG